MNKKVYTLIFLSFLLSFNMLTQTVSLTGAVTHHSGVSEEEVSVHCTNATSVVTGFDGVFTFTGLPSVED